MIVDNLQPPYYAVIFSNIKTGNIENYSKVSERMVELAQQQEGFLGVESASDEVAITVSYWKTLEDISRWKNNVEHTAARNLGREKWYKKYQLRICKVEREYGFEK